MSDPQFPQYPFGDGAHSVLDSASHGDPVSGYEPEPEWASKAEAFAAWRSAEKADVLALVQRLERMHTSAAATATQPDHRLRSEAKAATLRALIAYIFRDAHANAAKSGCSVRPVCPRCLDVVPGVPAGDPNLPHPGPFQREVCSTCETASASRTGSGS